MISLKRLKNPIYLSKVRAKVRPTRPNKALRLKNPLRKPRKKRKRRAAKDNARNLAPRQLELIPLRLSVAKNKKRRKKSEMPLKSLVPAAIKKGILSPIALIIRQKTSCSLGNFHISDC